MVKPDWGTKHKCYNCNASFYDLNKQPPICPKCETDLSKKRPKAASRSRAVATPAPIAEETETEEDDLLDDEKSDDTDELKSVNISGTEV